MKTITVASTKGSGKSTIVAALAVRAAQETPKIAMMDLNFDQRIAHAMVAAEGQAANTVPCPDVQNIPGDIRVIAAMKYEWLFIDLPGHGLGLDRTGGGCRGCRDYPVCGFFDVIAVQTVTWMCRKHRKPFAFVLSAVDGRYKVLTRNARGAFRSWTGAQNAYQLPAPLDTGAGHRPSRPELDKDLRPEIDALWGEVRGLAEKGACND